MINVRRPSSPGAATSFPLGNLAESLMRKHGWISVRTIEAGDTAPGLTILPRHGGDAGDLYGHAGVFDGPFPRAAVAAFGVTVETRSAVDLEVLDGQGAAMGRLCYPRMDVRPAAVAREPRPAPTRFVAADPRWNIDAFEYQAFQCGGRWSPVLWARPTGGDDAARPIAVTDGQRILFGVPFLELALAWASMPPLTERYWIYHRSPLTYAIEAWLADAVADLLRAAGVAGVRAHRWPAPYQAALTIRHDYDRIVSDAALEQLLGEYAALGWRSSWGFLVEKAPRHHADRLEAAGHEVMLHSIAGDESELLSEVASLERQTGRRALGSTTHGGGRPGYRGEHHVRWAEQARFAYAELLGGSIGLPMQAIVVDGGTPRLSDVILPNQHVSLDVTMRPEGHALGDLERMVPPAIATGDHVVIMNHPDIHRAELLALLAPIDRSAVWPATFRDLAAWSNATKFGARVDWSRGIVAFGGPLPAPARLTLQDRDGGVRTVDAATGAVEVSIGALGSASGAEYPVGSRA